MLCTSRNSGDNLHSTFDIATATGLIGFTGKPLTYTVPAGYSKLEVRLAGGDGGTYADTPHFGAQVTGTIDVTPGETFTLAVGDRGHGRQGGWGMPYKGSSFSGGNGLDPAHQSTGGGGGATAVLESNDNIVAVAGGSGGQSSDNSYGGPNLGEGGAGGAGPNNDGAGFDGSPDGSGGKAGGNGTFEGQSVDAASGKTAPGAGGGGVNGGLAGRGGTSGGGGAGSSYTAGLNPGASVTTSTHPGSPPVATYTGSASFVLSN